MTKLSSIILLIILFCTTLSLMSQPVILSGQARGAEGYVIRVIGYTDLVSMLEETLAYDTVKQDGTFSLTVEAQKVRYGFIDIDWKRAEIYLVPGEKVRLGINFDPSSHKAFYDRDPLEMEVIDEGMNHDIRGLNEYYNHFILENFNEIYRGRKSYLVDTLEANLRSMFPGTRDPYFSNYLKYKIATAEQFSGTRSRKALAEEYLLGQPILYENVEYNYFFNEFFEKYLLTGSKAVNVAMIMKMLEEKYPLSAFIDSISRDPLLNDAAVAGYFLLGSLKDLYYIPDFETEDILRVLRQIEGTSPFPRHRQIAANIIRQLTRLTKGTSAPLFELTSVEGQKVSLEQFRNHYVYLFFFRADNPVSIHEMDLLEERMSDLGPGIKVVGISADRTPAKAWELKEKNGYSFPLLHYGGNIELLEAYEARTYPLFLLLDKQGKILRYPAPWPGENGVEILMGL